MRLLPLLLAILTTLPQLASAPARAQAPGAAPAGPPHAYLFGTWTGGIFPAPANIPLQACLSQPVVIFTRDLVMRATITEQVLVQREIETARIAPGGIEFRFAGSAPPSRNFIVPTGPQNTGFGCEGPDVLHVLRRGENEIAFPGCADFPNPLVRCR